MAPRLGIFLSILLMASGAITGTYATTITSIIEHSQTGTNPSNNNSHSLTSTTTNPSSINVNSNTDQSSAQPSSSSITIPTSSNNSRNNSHDRAMTLKIDGIGERTGQGRNNQLLSTSQSNDVVIVATYCFTANAPGGDACLRDTAITDTAKLSFKEHGEYCHIVNGTYYWKSPDPVVGPVASSCVRDYYAIATEPLDRDNITSDDLSIFAFAVSGADINNVFDTRFPIGTDCLALDYFGTPSKMHSESPCTVNFDKEPHEFVFTITSINDDSSCSMGMDSHNDWTMIEYSAWGEIDILNKSTGSFSCTQNNSEPTVLMVDAIQAGD